MHYILLSEQRVPASYGAYYISDSGYDIVNGFYSFGLVVIKICLVLLLATCVCLVLDFICQKYKKYKLEMESLNKRVSALEEEVKSITEVEEHLDSNDELINQEKENILNVVDDEKNIEE